MAFRKQAAPLDAAALKDLAVRLLMGRPFTTAELRRKLTPRATSPADVDQVIAQLKDYGYLDDARFAEHFAGSRAASGRFGAQRVLSDLLKKRVASSTARRAVTDAYSGLDEIAQVEQFLERKYRGKDLAALLQDPRQLASAYRRLRTAGFPSGASIRVLKRYADAAEALEELEE